MGSVIGFSFNNLGSLISAKSYFDVVLVYKRIRPWYLQLILQPSGFRPLFTQSLVSRKYHGAFTSPLEAQMGSGKVAEFIKDDCQSFIVILPVVVQWLQPNCQVSVDFSAYRRLYWPKFSSKIQGLKSCFQQWIYFHHTQTKTCTYRSCRSSCNKHHMSDFRSDR